MSPLKWESILDLFGSLANLIAVFIAYLSLMAALRFRKEISFPEQVANIPELFKDIYLERQFNPPITINNIEYHTLRDVRAIVEKEIKIPGKDHKQGKQNFINKTLELGTWQNKFAYELSLGLQIVGSMVLMGALPINYILSGNGLQFIEDWGYCRKLITDKIRSEKGIEVLIKNQEIPVHRRHGEWLVCASAIYFTNRYKGKRLEELMSYIGDIVMIKKREREIRRFDADIIPAATKKAIIKLLQVKK
ncbi:MAG TPA: hypothetical protein VHY08_27195 [Bacillota bacterium]|nr:hypothetical protein [Bacillota bacterium]